MASDTRTTWTPGPWRMADFPAGYTFDSINAEGPRPVANVLRSVPEHKANAHLIASAPSLYEALEELIAEWDARDDVRNPPQGHGPRPDTQGIEMARAALASARGE